MLVSINYSAQIIFVLKCQLPLHGFLCLDQWAAAYITQFNSFRENRDKGRANSLQLRKSGAA